jgi:hypothetical protein
MNTLSTKYLPTCFWQRYNPQNNYFLRANLLSKDKSKTRRVLKENNIVLVEWTPSTSVSLHEESPIRTIRKLFKRNVTRKQLFKVVKEGIRQNYRQQIMVAYLIGFASRFLIAQQLQIFLSMTC